jgi:hypothetical protein
MANTACHTTLTSGAGLNFMKICISNHGNLVQFESPAGFEHIRLTDIGEGYIACSAVPNAGIDELARGFDAGFAESGFGAPTISQPNGPNSLPLTITRSTTDGIFRLTQTFSRDAAEKDVTITMTLRNISASAQQKVLLSRYFDGDIDNSTSDLSATSFDSVWGHDTYGLMLTALTLSTGHSAVLSKFANWNPNGPAGTPRHGRFSCRTFDNDPPLPGGDFVGWVTYNFGTLNAGASKTVKVLYRRF